MSDINENQCMVPSKIEMHQAGKNAPTATMANDNGASTVAPTAANEAVPADRNKKTPSKRTPSKRLSFIERAQKESEELLRNMGGSFELEGGRRTRSSTRGTTSSSLAALITPPPTKRRRKSPNPIAAEATPTRGPRARGRKLEGLMSQSETLDNKTSSTLNSINNNNKAKNFPEIKINDDPKKVVPADDIANVEISLVQGEKENQQTISTSEESKRSVREQVPEASSINQSNEIDGMQNSNEKMEIDDDKADTVMMVSTPVTDEIKDAAVDRVQENKNVDLTVEEGVASSEEEQADEVKVADARKELQQPLPGKTVTDECSSPTTTVVTGTTTTSSSITTSSTSSLNKMEQTVELSGDELEKDDEPDNNLIMEIDSDDNSSVIKAEESKTVAADDASKMQVKPKESKEFDSSKESTNSDEKSLQIDTISLDDSSAESLQQQRLEEANDVKKTPMKTSEVQSIEHPVSEDECDKNTIPPLRIADDEISLDDDADADNLSNKSESNVNDLRIVDDLESTDDADDAATSDDIKPINDNKLLLVIEEETNNDSVANDDSTKLTTDNNKSSEGSNETTTTTTTMSSTAPTTTEATTTTAATITATTKTTTTAEINN